MAEKAPADIDRPGGLIGKNAMTEIKFEVRVNATGLHPKPDDLPM